MLYIHYQEEKKIDISQLDSELSEIGSKLMMREMELTKLKESNKRLIKLLRDKKPGEAESQVAYFYQHAYAAVNFWNALLCKIHTL